MAHSDGDDGDGRADRVAAHDRLADPKPKHVVRQVLLGLSVLALVGYLLYSAVEEVRKGSSSADALKSLSPWWLVGILAGSIVVMLITTGTTAAPLPRISFQAAFLSQHASQAVGNLVPGPSAMAVRFSMLRSYGVSGDEFARATITVSLVTVIATSAMPLLGLVALALLGDEDSGASSMLPVAIGATVFAVIVTVLTAAMLRSERVTVSLANALHAAEAWLRRLLRRRPHRDPGVSGALAEREHLLQGLRESGKRVVGFVLLLYWANGLLVVLCLWATGVPYSRLGIIAGLAVYTIGRLSTLVQVTPGGVGVVEFAYTAAYTAYLGQEWQSKVFAGILLYRLGTYALPTVVGMVAGGIWALTARRDYREERLLHEAGLDSPVVPSTTEESDG